MEPSNVGRTTLRLVVTGIWIHVSCAGDAITCLLTKCGALVFSQHARVRGLAKDLSTHLQCH